MFWRLPPPATWTPKPSAITTQPSVGVRVPILSPSRGDGIVVDGVAAPDVEPLTAVPVDSTAVRVHDVMSTTSAAKSTPVFTIVRQADACQGSERDR